MADEKKAPTAESVKKDLAEAKKKQGEASSKSISGFLWGFGQLFAYIAAVACFFVFAWPALPLMACFAGLLGIGVLTYKLSLFGHIAGNIKEGVDGFDESRKAGANIPTLEKQKTILEAKEKADKEKAIADKKAADEKALEEKAAANKKAAEEKAAAEKAAEAKKLEEAKKIADEQAKILADTKAAAGKTTQPATQLTPPVKGAPAQVAQPVLQV